LIRTCKAKNERGEPCRQAPLVDGDFCFWHDPAYEKEATDARRVGGANHKKEQMLQGIYAVDGLESSEEIRRVLDLALVGELALDNSHNRSRVLVQIASAAARLLEVTELQRRVEALESMLVPRLAQQNQKKRNWWSR
jgi:hypothetical protein